MFGKLPSVANPLTDDFTFACGERFLRFIRWHRIVGGMDPLQHGALLWNRLVNRSVAPKIFRGRFVRIKTQLVFFGIGSVTQETLVRQNR